MNRILIIDDDEGIQEFLSEFLTSEGYQILSAENGQEGLELFNQYKPPVIILDLHMTEMGGIEFLKQFSGDLLMSHSIIVITGHGDDEEIESCFKYGVQTFLTKPINTYHLLGSISRSIKLIEANSKNISLNLRMESLNSLMRYVPDLLWECDTNNILTYLSDNVKDLLGYSPDDLIGTSMEELVAEEDLAEFQFKFDWNITRNNRKILGLPIHFIKADGKKIKTQLSSNAIFDQEGKIIGRVGVNRDMTELANIDRQIEKIVNHLTIRINEKLDIVEIDDSIHHLLDTELKTDKAWLDFTKYLDDPATASLIEFAFSQQEDVPFTIATHFIDNNSIIRNFNIDLKFISDGPWLEGKLIPVNTVDQLNLMTRKLDQQDEVLKKVIVFDEETKDAIIIDSKNLIDEILDLQKIQTEFAYPGTPPFLMEEFNRFIESKKMFSYKENLRLLNNKIHGLKGSLGFLIPETKRMIHEMEEIPRALQNFELVFTTNVSDFLRKFIFYIQNIIDRKTDDSDYVPDTTEMDQQIEAIQENGKKFLKGNEKTFKKLLEKRTHDDGKVRTRKRDKYLSVLHEGYDLLATQVKDLYYALSGSLTEEYLIQGRRLYNQFIQTHQQIDKLPLDMSRYERLIPAVAEEYDKEVKFSFTDNGVHSDQQFWNAMHEIFNHTLKNAVIHGIEGKEERERNSKNEIGTISVTLEENNLHKFVIISDDGRGIDVEKIREKAIKDGVMNPNQLQRMSKDELLNFIFMEGFSTSETLDENAGRGVGLNAVQEAMNKFEGSCKIETEPKQGTTWTFRFPKGNVTLSCFIVTIGDFRFAVLENNIEAYYRYRKSDLFTVNQNLSFRFKGEVITLVDPKQLFDELVELDEKRVQRILIFKSGEKKNGIVIDGILHHEKLPILPMPKEFAKQPLFLGVTMLGNDPIPVLSNKLAY